MRRRVNWVCLRCSHLNFGWRESCQRCRRSRSSSAVSNSGTHNSASGGTAPPQMWVQPMWPQLTPPMWSSSQQPPVMWPQPSPYPWWPMYQQPQPWLLVPQMLPWPPPTTTPYFVPLTEGSQSQPEVEHHHPPPQEQLSLPQSPRTEENEGADEEHGQDEGIEAHGEKTILENGVATPPH